MGIFILDRLYQYNDGTGFYPIKDSNFEILLLFQLLAPLAVLLLFVGEGLSRFYPYSQIMIALRSRALTDMSWMELLIFVLINAIYSILFFGLTVRELRK